MTGTSHLALAPEIDDFRRQFEQISAEAVALVAPLTDEQLYRKPAPDAWSIAQCIEHLNITARLYLPLLDEGIADAIRRGLYGRGPYHYNLIGRVLVWSLEPPPRFRMRTPGTSLPVPERPRQELMAAFHAYQVQYVDRLRQANGVDLARARVRALAPRWLWLPLGSGFASMAAHERRHLWQVRRLIAASSR